MNPIVRVKVGTWGMELARRLIDRYGVPLCFINGAIGGAAIQVFNERNPSNPMDLGTNYGQTLYRVKKAGLTGAIKAYFYRQGENETSGWSPGWPRHFDKLYANVLNDYPNLGRFYLFQIHILAGNNVASGVFRDYQRRLGQLHPLIQPIATVGTLEYDGIHFGLRGHAQTGEEVFRLVARDFYGSADTDQINPPDVKKVYFTNASHTELILQFDEGQHLTWPGDTLVYDTYGDPVITSMKQWFYLDGDSTFVSSGRTEANKVILTLNRPSWATKLGYLPHNYPTQQGWFPFPPGIAAAFPGPFITNERGLRAFAIWDVPVNGPPAPQTNLVANVLNNVISLSWTDHPAEGSYVLERKLSTETRFAHLASLSANTTQYTDSSAQQPARFMYRLRAVTSTAEATVDHPCLLNGVVQSFRSGNWETPRNWVCEAVPALRKVVLLAPNHTISLTGRAQATQLRLVGRLRIMTGGSLRLAP